MAVVLFDIIPIKALMCVHGLYLRFVSLAFYLSLRCGLSAWRGCVISQTQTKTKCECGLGGGAMEVGFFKRRRPGGKSLC